jgi:hypothetical protein
MKHISVISQEIPARGESLLSKLWTRPSGLFCANELGDVALWLGSPLLPFGVGKSGGDGCDRGPTPAT